MPTPIRCELVAFVLREFFFVLQFDENPKNSGSFSHFFQSAKLQKIPYTPKFISNELAIHIAFSIKLD